MSLEQKRQMQLEKRRLSVLLAIVAIGASALAVSFHKFNFSLAARNMAPLLPLSAPQYELGFQVQALRDPEILSRKPETDGDAARLAEEIKEFRSDLARAKGDRALELHEMAYQSAAALAYFFEDVQAGRLESPDSKGNAGGNLQSMRAMVVYHAQKAAHLSKNEGRKSRALYYLYTTQFAMNQAPAKAGAELGKLADGSLSKKLKSRAELVSSLYQLERGGAKARVQAEARLSRVVATLPNAGQVAVEIAVARSLAGLSHNLKRVGGSHPSYRQHLARAATKTHSLTAQEKEQTLRLLIGIWRGAEGANGDWSKAPFNMNLFAGAMDTKAVVERSALADWQQNKKDVSLRKYESLAKSLTGSPARAALDLRVLDMKRAAVVDAPSSRAYEASLINLEKTYLDPGVLGDGNEAKAKAVAQEILSRHKSFVYAELARATAKNKQNAERTQAIRMAETYLTAVTEAKEIEDVKGRIAGLYALNCEHGKAVAIYKELAEMGEKANAKRYYVLAIASQSVLASWPLEAPWSANVSKGSRGGEREELLMLYQKLNGLESSWTVIAHVGLLQLASGQQDQAFALWTETLKKDAKGSHAAHAAGTMLVTYKGAKDWPQLETLSRLALAAQMRPQYRGTPVDPFVTLGLALLENGKGALEQGQFALAVTKLKEFVVQHASAERHDEGFYLLASAYRGNGQHTEAIKTLLAFVDRYQKSSFYRAALLNGGDWSSEMAFEENVMFFYNRFVSRFGADGEGQRVRTALTELYVGRALYAEAIGILNLTSRAKVDAGVRADALSQILEIEERHGSLDSALATADRVLADKTVSDDTKGRALALKARVLARDAKLAEVQQIDGKLAAMSTSPGVTEALGEVRYLIAVAQGKTVTTRFFNLALKDPESTLNGRYKAYEGARAAFLKVCEAGQSGYCAPSMHRLARFSEAFMKSIEDIEIQDTLAKEVVDGFRSTKQRIMDEVTKVAKHADSKAVATLSEGSTDPDWVQAVLWQNNGDWNFERVSGETGNGYLQWADDTSKSGSPEL
ncbi:hypothetical protein E3A20_09980 [Planctomyces bekefii]|uniref:Tetratricopeptide repeat protein n=1 Tax=Planctomyces bekefii TaxID=1653850 RepID=A0A5C6MA88_9PLAN|nr:hypothetical protein E3A20_09980 [Planctomyces bekefii]